MKAPEPIHLLNEQSKNHLPLRIKFLQPFILPKNPVQYHIMKREDIPLIPESFAQRPMVMNEL